MVHAPPHAARGLRAIVLGLDASERDKEEENQRPHALYLMRVTTKTRAIIIIIIIFIIIARRHLLMSYKKALTSYTSTTN